MDGDNGDPIDDTTAIGDGEPAREDPAGEFPRDVQRAGDGEPSNPGSDDPGSSDNPIDTIGNQLIRLGRIRERTSAQVAAASGGEFEISAYGIIFRLLADGPMRSGTLAEVMLSDASTISRQVAGLVKRGLIERRADPDDGRASMLVVTESGRALAEQLHQRRSEILAHIVADWEPDDRQQLATLLRRFVDDYESARPTLLELWDTPRSQA